MTVASSWKALCPMFPPPNKSVGLPLSLAQYRHDGLSTVGGNIRDRSATAASTTTWRFWQVIRTVLTSDSRNLNSRSLMVGNSGEVPASYPTRADGKRLAG